MGIHPEEAFDLGETELRQLAHWAENPKVVAIGEIGLDYYWEKDGERRLQQQKTLICQLDLARQLHLPVCIHDREAHGDLLRILKQEGKGLSGVLHCFSGSWEMAEAIFRMGWLIGVDGPLTFKNAAKLPEIIRRAPRDMVRSPRTWLPCPCGESGTSRPMCAMWRRRWRSFGGRIWKKWLPIPRRTRKGFTKSCFFPCECRVFSEDARKWTIAILNEIHSAWLLGIVGLIRRQSLVL